MSGADGAREDTMSDSDGFVSLVIYPSTAHAQVGQADTLLRMTEEPIREMPGFVSGRIFLAEGGDCIISMVEWRDRESFLQFRSSDFGRAAVQVAGELHPKAYWLTPHAQVTAP
jgi:heme-degrading monooxygenase HmoA